MNIELDGIDNSLNALGPAEVKDSGLLENADSYLEIVISFENIEEYNDDQTKRYGRMIILKNAIDGVREALEEDGTIDKDYCVVYAYGNPTLTRISYDTFKSILTEKTKQE